jgi:CRP-like cAMP-binding protein
MTITAVNRKRPSSGDYEGLLLASDPVISGFLGDAEGPAHVEWSKEEKRLTRNWRTFTRRIGFVTNGIVYLADMLRENQPKTAPLALAKVFSVRLPAKPEGPTSPTIDRPEEIQSRKDWYTIGPKGHGFSIRSVPNAPRPAVHNLRVTFAYDVSSGDPFRIWSPFDFELRLGQASTLRLKGSGVKAKLLAGNEVLRDEWPRLPILIGRGDAPKLIDPAGNLSGAFGLALKSPPADRLLEDGERLELAGFTINVFEIPGHSSGHVVFCIEDTTPPLVFGGDVLFREGEAARTLYVVSSGALEVVKRRGDGEVVLGAVLPGECVGEMSFIDMQPRSATVRALQPSELWVWTYQSIHERYCEDQKCAMLLVMNIARELSRRLRRADEMLSSSR